MSVTYNDQLTFVKMLLTNVVVQQKKVQEKNFKKITKIQKIKEEDEAVVKTKEIQIKIQGNPIIYIEKIGLKRKETGFKRNPSYGH